MSSLLSADDLNDFIRPSVACIKPVQEQNNKKKNDNEHIELEFDVEVEIDKNGDMIQVEKANEDEIPIVKKKLEKAQISLADCLACSGCITSSEEVLISQHSFQEFINHFNENKNENIHYVLNLSQQSRASLANVFNISIKLIDRVLSKIFKEFYGFEFIVSVNHGRKIAYNLLYQEVNEFKKNNENKSLLASICPGWVLYVEKTHPELKKQMSKVRSPQYITCRLIKEILSKEYEYSKSKIYNLSIMPCFDKKLEASRDSDIVDCVITPKELINLIEQDERIDLDKIFNEELMKSQTESYEDFVESVSPRGWYNGNLYGFGDDEGNESGGYSMNYLLEYKRINNLKDAIIKSVQGRNEDVYELQLIENINSDRILCRAGVINGFKNIQNLVRKLNEDEKGINAVVKKKKKMLISSRGRRGNKEDNSGGSNITVDLTKCEFVEVMACPGGCINGGGQISAGTTEDSKAWRLSVAEKYRDVGIQSVQEENLLKWMGSFVEDIGDVAYSMVNEDIGANETVPDVAEVLLTSASAW
jgi:iron only hydrogenase large subunit-like protein